MPQNISLKDALKQYAQIGDKDFAMAASLFKKHHYKKGEVRPLGKVTGDHLLFLTKGISRVFYYDPETSKEINTYFFMENQFMFSFMQFNEEHPSHYFVEALEDCEADVIHNNDLEQLYTSSHQWEHFGRLLAIDYYRIVYKRYESFTFNNPEQRYLALIKNNPKIFQRISLQHISSYLGIEKQSLSRIRNRIVKTKK